MIKITSKIKRVSGREAKIGGKMEKKGWSKAGKWRLMEA
jgi:hypothetical protein